MIYLTYSYIYSIQKMLLTFLCFALERTIFNAWGTKVNLLPIQDKDLVFDKIFISPHEKAIPKPKLLKYDCPKGNQYEYVKEYVHNILHFVTRIKCHRLRLI